MLWLRFSAKVGVETSAADLVQACHEVAATTEPRSAARLISAREAARRAWTSYEICSVVTPTEEGSQWGVAVQEDQDRGITSGL